MTDTVSGCKTCEYAICECSEPAQKHQVIVSTRVLFEEAGYDSPEHCNGRDDEGNNVSYEDSGDSALVDVSGQHAKTGTNASSTSTCRSAAICTAR